MSRTVIDKISQNPENITKEDVDNWIVSELVEFFEPKFSSLASYAYGQLDNGSDIAKRAFRELATETLEKGVSVFLFKSQHWRKGRKIQPYLATCLNRLADNIKKDVSSQKKVSIPVCPACKSLNEREFLRYEGKRLRCTACTNQQLSLEDRIKTADSDEKPRLEYELRLRRVFSVHSRKGYKCPDCSRFIPESCIKGHRASCPYDSDCHWFGHIDELEPMAHPLGLSSQNNLSLNSTVKFESGKEVERQESIKSEDANADIRIEVRQRCEQEIKALKDVIEAQSKRLKREQEHKSIKKILMYEAFGNMVKKCPEEMVSYLVHQNHAGEIPIQSRIFQEFISLVENSLPIEVYNEGKVVEVYSLQDPRLDLFTGLSEFEAYVQPDGSIPNCTKEVYIGGRKRKDFGPCFIGQLIDVRVHETDSSILDFVEFYTFSQIRMKEDVPPGLKVKVRHFRIPSHYEMHGLVHLQRIRRKIVDSVYQRLNGKRRVVGK